MRSVQTVGSTHAQRARISPPCGAVAGTTDGVCSIVLSFTLPPSCLPWLHGHYPASTLLRRLCHLPGAVLRALPAAMNAAPSRIVIPDSCRSNFQPFYLHPPHAFRFPRSLSRRGSVSLCCRFPFPGSFPFWASPFPSRLANASGRIEFIIFLIMDWLFASGCSPPRLSATQLPSATDSQCSVRRGLSPRCWCALSGALGPDLRAGRFHKADSRPFRPENEPCQR